MIETENANTSTDDRGNRATVYSTAEHIRVVFSNGDIEASAWLTEQLARELIVLLAAVVNGVPKKQPVAVGQ